MSIVIRKFKVMTGSRQVMGRFGTLQECVDYLHTLDTSLNEYWIEDLEDEIEVPADEVLAAWKNGERCEDLQGF